MYLFLPHFTVQPRTDDLTITQKADLELATYA